MSLPVATIGLVGGGSKAWKISFDKTLSKITVGYGTMFYNGKFLVTNNITNGTIKSGFGTDQEVFGINATSQYVYLHITNPLSLPSETAESTTIKIGIETSFDDPDNMNENAPLIQYLPLAFVDSTNSPIDLRPAFIVHNFTFLA